MNIPDDLEITDSAGNARKNGEERKAINAILEYLRDRDQSSRSETKPFPGESAKPGGFWKAESLVPNPQPAMWSNAYAEKNSLDDIPAGTIDESYFGTTHPSVRVMEKHVLNDGSVKSVWMTYTREQARARAMVAEDEVRTDEE